MKYNVTFLLLISFYCQHSISKHQAHIASFIVDLKYDGRTIKLLECGGIEGSVFKGHRDLYGTGVIWSNLWNSLSQHNLPLFYVDSQIKSSDRIERKALKKLTKLGGYITQNQNILITHPTFKQAAKQESKNIPQGIIVSRTSILRNAASPLLHSFLILNKVVYQYGHNKKDFAQLFEDEYLQQYRPEWAVYSTNYNNNLAKQICKDFTANTLVIKPISSTKGNGVIVVEKKDLDETLQNIFKDRKKIQKTQDSSYSYWVRNKPKEFLVESFEESKPIEVNGNYYDATMRVVFVIDDLDNELRIDFLGCYWKLPAKSLDYNGSLTEKHKSKIENDTCVCSAVVDQEDQEQVYALLQNILPRLYEKMLTHA